MVRYWCDRAIEIFICVGYLKSSLCCIHIDAVHIDAVQKRGCVYHCANSIMQKVKSLGLQSAYRRDVANQKYCRRLIALSFLPHEHIPMMFNALAEKANTQQLENLVDYMRSTWVENATWPPEAWSIFMQPIPTNNDLDGWHRRLNTQSKLIDLQQHYFPSRSLNANSEKDRHGGKNLQGMGRIQ